MTSNSRQVQRTAREAARRIRPTVRSDSGVETNKCLPAERQDQQWSVYYSTNTQVHYLFRDHLKNNPYVQYIEIQFIVIVQGWAGFQ